MNFRNLNQRDPALMASLGLKAGADFGGVKGPSVGFGANKFGGFGADATAPTAATLALPISHPMHPLHPANQANTMAVLQQHAAATARTDERQALLDPNIGSTVRVERYDFSISQALTLGTAATLFMSLQPSVTMRPQRCAFNAPMASFCTISTIQVANVNALVGGATDAYIYGPNSQGIHLDLPTLSPSNKMTVSGNYTGVTPPGFPAASAFLFVSSFQGPAKIVA